ncbi:MAG TPA: serine hydrolase [Pyrinomonadaceae bacterium]|nr:serine hydrolase [Pyrinomonadaceae bacterium]
MRIRLISVLILFLLIPVAYGQAPEPGFDEYVQQAMKQWEVPGLAIAVVKDDRIVFAKGYGVREIGGTAAVNEHTLFAIGSSSKAFTAATLAVLVDEGKIKWDDPVTKYLPAFQLFDPYSTREMTVRDLVTHRSGLERGDRLWYASPYDRNEVLRRVRFLKPSWSVRSRFGYQNIMFLAAGQISPAVTGKEWDDVVRERIFVPLGMTSSSTSITKFAGQDNVASPHSKIDDKLQKVAWRNIDNIGPAGSINSNVTDMAQWLRMNLGGGMYDNKRVLSAASVKEMQTPQTVIRIEGNNERLYPVAHFLNYGLGWFLSDFRGRKLVEHGGAIDGMRAVVGMLPEEKVGVVILTNRQGSVLPHVLMYRVFDAYLGVAKKDWSAEMFPKFKAVEDMAKAAEKKTEDERVKGTSPSLALEKYAGTYQNEMYGDAKFALKDGKLTSEFGPNFNGDLEHWHYNTFRVVWRDSMGGKGFINFKLNAKGQPETVSIEGLGEFTRVPDKPAPGAVSSN